MRKIFVVEHFAWRQMKENYQIYLPYHSVDGDSQLPNKKIKTVILWNM